MNGRRQHRGTGGADSGRVRRARAWTTALLVALLFPLLVVPAATASNLFGLVDTGELFASTDGGVTWAVRSTLPVADAVALAAGATRNDLYLVSESGSFYRSTDAGVSWNAIAAVPAADVCTFVAAPSGFLLATRSGSIYASADQGVNWTAVGTITVSDVVSATFDGSDYYALAAAGGVYRSGDGGASWSAVGALSIPNGVEIVAYDGNLWVMTATGDLAQSVDSGANWAFVSTLSQVGMTALVAGEGELLASTVAGEVAATPTGSLWTWRGVINQITVRSLATDIPTVTGVGPAGPPPLAFSLPWPNPATEAIHFALDLDAAAIVEVSVYDMAGRRVARPVQSEWFGVGRTARTWRPRALEPGVYVLQARAGAKERTRRVIWIAR